GERLEAEVLKVAGGPHVPGVGSHEAAPFVQRPEGASLVGNGRHGSEPLVSRLVGTSAVTRSLRPLMHVAPGGSDATVMNFADKSRSYEVNGTPYCASHNSRPIRVLIRGVKSS